MAVSVWSEKFPIQDAPKKELLLAEVRKFLDSLLPGILNGFLALCPETAKIVVVPPVTVEEQLRLIDTYKIISDQKDSKNWWPEGWNHVGASGWKVGITDGKEDMDFDPTIYFENPDVPKDQRRARTNEAMVAGYKHRFASCGLGIMPQHGYIPAAAGALAEQKVLDRQFATYFEIPSGADDLPNGYWRGDRVCLDWNFPWGSREGLRCRPWVEGEMKV